ncbi:MAG: uracil-DNA glycosylase [Bacillota bacterium]
MAVFATMAELEQALGTCARCPLGQEPHNGPTTFNGSPQSAFAIVGEGPGRVEDEYGVPLVGPSGQLLDKALASVGITRDLIYTSNVIKCRPRNNRTPTVDEGQFCAGQWLDAEMALVKPKVIVALGSVALKYLHSPAARITKDRGQWFMTKYGIPAVGTYHPAYLLRLTGKELVRAKWETYYDLKAAVEKFTVLAPEAVLKSDNPPDLLALYEARRQSRMKRSAEKHLSE